MRAGTNTKVFVWLREIEISEKRIGHRRVVVLPRMDQ
jgi:hypothetical protein